MPHPAESIFKYVLGKDFAYEKFSTKYFNDLWKNLLDYVKSNNRGKEKGVFGKKAQIDFAKMQQTLEKILPLIKQGSYGNEKIQFADSFFAILLHSETPEEVRRPFSKVYLSFLKSCSESEIAQIKVSLSFFAPLSALIRCDSEKATMAKYREQSEAIICMEGTPSSQNDVIFYLKDLFDYLIQNWEQQSGGFLFALFQYVLYPLYGNCVPAPGFDQCYSLQRPVIIQIHECICNFFLQIFSNKDRDFNAFFKERKYSAFMMEILNSTCEFKSDAAIKSTLQSFSNIVSHQIVCIALAELNLLKTLGTYCLNVILSSDNQYSLFQQFTFYLFTPSNFNSSDDLGEMITQLINASLQDEKALITLFESLLGTLLVNGYENQNVWKIICNFIKQNEKLALVACKYAQLLMVLKFPSLFYVDMDTIIDECLDAFYRAQKNKITTDHDFIAENIKLIMKEPVKFVEEKMTLKMTWEPFSNKDETIKFINIFCFPDKFTSDSATIPQGTTAFLSALSQYKQEEGQQQRENLFSVISSFYGTIPILKMIPPGIKYDHISAFMFLVRPMIEAVNNESNENIIIHSLTILDKMVNTSDIKSHVTPQFLSHWFFTLCLTALSSKDSVSSIGIQASISTILIAFEGSGMLIPIILQLIQQKKIINEKVTSFLSSFSIFRVDHQISNSLISQLSSIIDKQNDRFNPNWRTILNTSNINLVDLCLETIDEIYNAHKSDEKIQNYVVEICSSIIIDESLQKDPQIKIIERSISILCYYVESLSLQAFLVLGTFGSIANNLIQICPNEFTKILETSMNASQKINSQTDPMFVFTYMRTMTNLIISSEKISRSQTIAPVFANFLQNILEWKDLPADYPPQIQEYASKSVDMLSIFLGGYPYPSSEAFPSSRMPKRSEKQPMIYMPNGTFITPDIDITENGEEKAVFAVQTDVGQFVWNMQPIADKIYPFIEKEKFELDLPAFSSTDQCLHNINEDKNEQVFIKGFHDVIESFENNFNEIYPLEQIPSEELNEIDSIEKEIENAYSQYSEDLSEEKYDDQRKPFTYIPNYSCDKVAAAGLNVTGIVINENSSELKKATESESMRTLLSKTLSTNHRVRVKAALAYAAPQSYDQSQILSTTLEMASPKFKEFMSLLGWNVALKNFPCYSGGLDTTEDRGGVSSIYCSHFDYELMYHAAPLMPTNPKDSQQINKKKHVGNDHIQVIFVENNREYEAYTITSQFNFVTIIVYPLQLGLYRVTVHYRDSVSWFGPLHEPKIVTKEALAQFINSTIIVAMLNIWNNSIQYFHPVLDLSKKVTQMGSEFIDNNQESLYNVQILLHTLKTNEPKAAEN